MQLTTSFYELHAISNAIDLLIDFTVKLIFLFLFGIFDTSDLILSSVFQSFLSFELHF